MDSRKVMQQINWLPDEEKAKGQHGSNLKLPCILEYIYICMLNRKCMKGMLVTALDQQQI